jgi:hypothetical protein
MKEIKFKKKKFEIFPMLNPYLNNVPHLVVVGIRKSGLPWESRRKLNFYVTLSNTREYQTLVED